MDGKTRDESWLADILRQVEDGEKRQPPTLVAPFAALGTALIELERRVDALGES